MRAFFVPIKAILGNYFVAEIEKHLYVFRMNEKIITYRHTAVRSFRWYFYTTDHYLPLSPPQLKEIETVLDKNDLPRVNMMLFNILKYLGKREKKEFESHKVAKLIEELSAHEDKYSEQIQNILNYLDHLAIEQIVTPVRKMTEFIEDDLIATDPKFFGDVINHYKRTDVNHQKINNVPITGKKNWLLIGMIMAIIGMIAFGLIWAVQTGKFDNVLPDFSNFKGIQLQPPGSLGGGGGGDIMSRYPDPYQLKVAIAEGRETIENVPAQFRDMVNNAKPPEITPVP